MALFSLLWVHGREMDYSEVLGQVIREVRVASGISREACGHVLNRDHLAKVEQGHLAISVLKFNSLCQCLGISQSLMLMAVEARLSAVDLISYREQQESEFTRLVENGLLSRTVNAGAVRGVRGKKADENRLAIRALQAEGLTKMDIVRKLGISRATVDRYWLRS